jgi:hypothetical protein
MLHPAGGGVGTKVLIPEISTQGCTLEGAVIPGGGKKCELYVEWRGAHIGLEGKVVWQDVRGRIGLKFLSVPKETLKRLAEMCEALSMQRPPAPPQAVETRRTALGTGTERTAAHRAEVPSKAPSPPQSPARERPRRSVPRYLSELRARLSDPESGAGWSVTVVNLSVLGACLEGMDLPPAGGKCVVETEWEGRSLRIGGQIVWKSGQGSVGVRFDSPEEDSTRLLRQICANLKLQPMAPLPPEV